MNDQTQKERIALRAVYEQRVCPPDDILFASPHSEELEAHLGYCRFCAERLAMTDGERKSWELVSQRVQQELAPLPTDANPAPGQIWSLRRNMLGGWGPLDRYFNPPLVLLLESLINDRTYRAAQICNEEALQCPADVRLPDDSGFVEPWNAFVVHRDHLNRFIGSTGELIARRVIKHIDEMPEDSQARPLIKQFHELEKDVARVISERAQIMVLSEHEPQTGILEILAGWVRPLAKPVRLTSLAAMIVAVVSIAIFYNSNDGKRQIAKVPGEQYSQKPPPTTPPDTKPTSPDAQKPGIPVKPPAPATAPTLMASAGSVMDSKTITKVETFQEHGQGFAAISTDDAALKIGSAFVDLVAAGRSGDSSAKAEATKQLESLIPVIAGGSSIKLPVSMDDKHAINTFAREIEQAAAKSGQLMNLRFGSWLQSARLADDEHLLRIVTPSLVEHFRNNVKSKTEGHSITAAFDILKKSADEGSTQTMRRALDEIKAGL
ncbi:MAG: hypothetical protein WCP10_15155 [Desulfuromonadales bacterium]